MCEKERDSREEVTECSQKSSKREDRCSQIECVLSIHQFQILFGNIKLRLIKALLTQ
jgi:hypothetical protein